MLTQHLCSCMLQSRDSNLLLLANKFVGFHHIIAVMNTVSHMCDPMPLLPLMHAGMYVV